MHVCVIGAGVVGLATAYALQQAGHHVTVVDRAERPAMGASSGNGAQLSYAYVQPLADPGIWKMLPRLLLVGVLNGALMVMADLSRTLTRHCEMDWMAISSYGSGTQSSGVVRILKDLNTDLSGRHVLVVEDVLDDPPSAPVCLAGKMACPPEDCGGLGGYEELAAWVRGGYDPRATPMGLGAQEMRDWLPRGWHPDRFSVTETNDALAASNMR